MLKRACQGQGFTPNKSELPLRKEEDLHGYKRGESVAVCCCMLGMFLNTAAARF